VVTPALNGLVMVSMDSTVMKIILINTVLVTPNSLPDLWEVLSPS
jgi:hypothetical protein